MMLAITLSPWPEPVQEIAMTQHTVLVIDDEAPVRDAVTDILVLEDMSVVTAPDGQTGIELYRLHQSEIRLIILDMSMPGLNGEETFHELRQINAQVPVLLSTGYSQDELVQRFAGQPAVGFVQKPYEINTLITEVRRCLAA
jgi:DNA-binding NtrC family response regulator